MASMNIAGLAPVNDPAYRYKMPKLIGKVEGKGNGIKTVLVNIDQVAESLKREPAEVTKFFGTELGLSPVYDSFLFCVGLCTSDLTLFLFILKVQLLDYCCFVCLV